MDDLLPIQARTDLVENRSKKGHDHQKSFSVIMASFEVEKPKAIDLFQSGGLNHFKQAALDLKRAIGS